MFGTRIFTKKGISAFSLAECVTVNIRYIVMHPILFINLIYVLVES